MPRILCAAASFCLCWLFVHPHVFLLSYHASVPFLALFLGWLALRVARSFLSDPRRILAGLSAGLVAFLIIEYALNAAFLSLTNHPRFVGALFVSLGLFLLLDRARKILTPRILKTPLAWHAYGMASVLIFGSLCSLVLLRSPVKSFDPDDCVPAPAQTWIRPILFYPDCPGGPTPPAMPPCTMEPGFFSDIVYRAEDNRLFVAHAPAGPRPEHRWNTISSLEVDTPRAPLEPVLEKASRGRMFLDQDRRVVIASSASPDAWILTGDEREEPTPWQLPVRHHDINYHPSRNTYFTTTFPGPFLVETDADSLRPVRRKFYPFPMAHTSLDHTKNVLYAGGPTRKSIDRLDPETLRVIDRIPGRYGTTDFQADGKRGLLYTVNYLDGRVDVLDTGTKRILASAEIGLLARRVFLDDRTGRVFTFSRCGIFEILPERIETTTAKHEPWPR